MATCAGNLHASELFAFCISLTRLLHVAAVLVCFAIRLYCGCFFGLSSVGEEPLVFVAPGLPLSFPGFGSQVPFRIAWTGQIWRPSGLCSLSCVCADAENAEPVAKVIISDAQNTKPIFAKLIPLVLIVFSLPPNMISGKSAIVLSVKFIIQICDDAVQPCRRSCPQTL